MLIDPQGADNTYGGLGAVAMLYFSEDGKDVTVNYYSVFKDKYFMSDSQFSMTLDVVGDDDNTDAENNNNNNDENNGGENNQNTQKPDTTEAIKKPTESKAETAEEDGGCGSVMAVSTVGVVALTALGACFVPRKKKK